MWLVSTQAYHPFDMHHLENLHFDATLFSLLSAQRFPCSFSRHQALNLPVPPCWRRLVMSGSPSGKEDNRRWVTRVHTTDRHTVYDCSQCCELLRHPPSLPACMQFHRLLKQQLAAKEWEKSLPPPPKPVQGVSSTTYLFSPSSPPSPSHPSSESTPPFPLSPPIHTIHIVTW